MSEQQLHYLHALSVVCADRLPTLHRLLTAIPDPIELWNASSTQLSAVRAAPTFVDYFSTQRKQIDVSQLWSEFCTVAEREQIQLLHRESDQYPILLKEIAQPPHLLYCRGNLSLLNATRTVAVVGTRMLTQYGELATQDIVSSLVRASAVIVSGLAFGIDAVAHSSALEHAGSTIAVLGSSVLESEIAPHANQYIARNIIEHNGLLVSEYPPHTKVQARFFPERNRIIAGLSHATIVVEAAQKSGSLITARYALEQNRDVFAVPGSIYSNQSIGTNALIERGAIPVTSCDSIIDALQYDHTQQTLSFSEYSDTEIQILQACIAEPRTVDQLIQLTSLSTEQIIQTISLLCLKGILQETSPQHYLCSKTITMQSQHLKLL